MSYLDRLKAKISEKSAGPIATKATKAPFVPFVAPLSASSQKIADATAIPEIDAEAGLSREGVERFAFADLTDDRITCEQCANRRGFDGRCKVAAPNGIVIANTGYSPDPVLQRRCEGYQPKADDPDQRRGMDRWPRLREIAQ
jgi:hypothetical protein